MFPLDFLRLSGDRHVTVFLKNGETLAGTLANMDGYMNLKLKGAILTSKNGNARKISEVFVRGLELKNVQLPNVILDEALGIEKSRTEYRASVSQSQSKGDYGRSFGRQNMKTGQYGRSIV